MILSQVTSCGDCLLEQEGQCWLARHLGTKVEIDLDALPSDCPLQNDALLICSNITKLKGA
jgi:hypothetical protein